MDSCKCQTLTASPAEPGELPWELVRRRWLVGDSDTALGMDGRQPDRSCLAGLVLINDSASSIKSLNNRA